MSVNIHLFKFGQNNCKQNKFVANWFISSIQWLYIYDTVTGISPSISWEIWLFLVLNFHTPHGWKMWCEVILLKIGTKGEITEHYFNVCTCQQFFQTSCIFNDFYRCIDYSEISHITTKHNCFQQIWFDIKNSNKPVF